MNLFASYQEWYKEISLLLHGEKELVCSGESKYVFMKKNCGECPRYLILIAYRKGCKNDKNPRRIFYIEDDEKQLWMKMNFILLHPQDYGKSLKMEESGQHKDNEQWNVNGVTNDFYHSEEKSAIIFGILN